MAAPVFIYYRLLAGHGVHVRLARSSGASRFLAFDQIGFGTRIRSAREFYKRYPRWSLMGKMVADTRAALDAGCALSVIDRERVYVVGYALGGKVGLLTAALDERIKAAGRGRGFDPLRLDSQAKGVEGVRQYSHLHGLIPRLGFFAGNEDRLPLDFDEVLALVAPRPALIVAPTLDRYARVEDVRLEVEEARRIYERSRPQGRASARNAAGIQSLLRQRLQGQVFDWLDRPSVRAVAVQATVCDLT